MCIKTTEDILKLHNEANQLRNQQFILTTVALTVVGFSSWMIPSLKGGPKSELLQLTVTVFLQFLLAILFIWSIALRRLIGIISAYLKVKKASDWEIDFYKFSTNKSCGHWSQTGWVRLVYVVLGLLLTGNFILLSLAQGFQLIEWPVLFMCLSTVLYVTVILYFAWIARKYDKEVEDKWNNVIKQ
jgi:hypothetical protein